MADSTRWHQDTLDWICCNRQVIKDIAEALGVPPEAIAGIMAKENDWYRHGPDPRLQWGADQYAYARTFDYSHSDWQQESLLTREMGPTKWEKGMLPSLIDAGLANFQIATAIRLLETYKAFMQLNGDKLGLEPYVNDYNNLVRTLTRGDYTCGGEGIRLTAALYGLMVAEALAFFETQADPAYWNGLSQETKDAIVVTYCSRGRKSMEDQWKRDTAWTPDTGPQLPYEPKPGAGSSGGDNHLYNASRIGRAMLNPNYGGGGLPRCTILDPETCQPRTVDCFPPPPGPAGPLYRRDPLVLDLDGNGIQTTNVNGRTYFDQDSNGFAEQTGWVAPNDGLLVMDRNGDGLINNGKELFGDQTVLKSGAKAANGFQALADLDDNKDGRIDASDSAFSKLRVWKDFSGDGFSFPNELFTLDELDIKSINLNSTIANITAPQGNTENRVGSFEKVDGTTGQIADYTLQRDTRYAIANEWLEVPEDIATLPDSQGYGNVYDLHQAMVRDTSGQLKSLVEQFVSASDPNARNSLMQEILFKWTGSEGINPGSRGPNIDARKLAVLERFYGQSFAWLGSANPTYEAAISLNETYRQVSEMIYAELMGQTHLKDLYGQIIYTWDEEKQQYNTDFGPVIAVLQAQLTNDPEQGKQVLSEFARTMRGFGNDRVHCLDCREFFIQMDQNLGWVIDTGELPVYEHPGQGQGWWRHITGTDNADAVKGSLTEGDGWITGLNGNDVIYGTDRNEYLYHETGDALLVAGGGNDQIWAGAGNDILDGGPGDDLLYGEAGNDTYIFRRGSGRDTIIDPDATPNNTDTIWLGSSLTPDDVILRRMGNNLVLKIRGTNETLTVQDHFRNNTPLNKIEQIQFMDGTVWTEADILQEISMPSEEDDNCYGGTGDDQFFALGGNDTVYGREGNDTLDGGTGNDTLYGEAGNDTLTGGPGNDKLVGNAGNDVFDGGPGDDTLYGGSDNMSWRYEETADGDDTYLFERGSGHDTIIDRDTTGQNTDTILLGEDIVPSDINLQLLGTDLKLTISDTQDSITIKNWVQGETAGCGVQTVRFPHRLIHRAKFSLTSRPWDSQNKCASFKKLQKPPFLFPSHDFSGRTGGSPVKLPSDRYSIHN